MLYNLMGEPFSYSVKNMDPANAEPFRHSVHEVENTGVVSAAYVRCQGDFHFGFLWHVQEKDLRLLAKKMLGRYHIGAIENLEISSVSEFGNILTASIVNAVCNERYCRLISTVPGFAVESLRALLGEVISDFETGSADFSAFAAEFHGTLSGIKLGMLLVENPPREN